MDNSEEIIEALQELIAQMAVKLLAREKAHKCLADRAESTRDKLQDANRRADELDRENRALKAMLSAFKRQGVNSDV